jgi:uncharacterized membrane protein
METRTRTATGGLAALGALAVGALLLSNKVKVSTAPAPAVTVDRTLDVRVPVGKTLVTAAALAAGALLASKLMQRSRTFGTTSSMEESIVLNVPVSTAYNQWTQFEEFPRFMESVEEVRQLDDTHLHWRANVAGKTKEWDAEITEQVPDERIAWRSIGGVQNAGVVTFHKLGENRTKVMLQMDYNPQTPAEKIGDAVGGVKLTAKGNLKRFKNLVERRGVETGAWRGTVAQH